MSSGPMVAVLDADPELGTGLDMPALAYARREALAPLLTLEPGSWSWEPGDGNLAGNLGLLVLDGVVTRSQTVGALRSIEFLGSGDILRPWVSAGPVGPADTTQWRAILPTRIAILDQDFALRVRHWPQISAALLERATARSRSLSLRLAIHQAVRVHDRVHLMLWHLAERWGHVTPEGTVLRMRLTHEAIAQLVGAQRSPVTVALGDLKRNGLVERGPGGAWLLHGAPPQPAPRRAPSAPDAKRCGKAGRDRLDTEPEHEPAKEPA